MSAGLFVVLEGGDGVGKTSQARWLADRLEHHGREVLLTREPGDTALGARVRELLLHEHDLELAPRAEALLYAADKAQHLDELVRPALDRGAVVICDRYVDSMLAYQGAGRVLVVDEVEQVARWATDGLRPDLTVVLDLDPAEAVAVKQGRDRLESAGLEFHRRVRDGFLQLAARDPQRYLVVPAREHPDRITEEIWARLQPLLAGHGIPPVSEPGGTVGS